MTEQEFIRYLYTNCYQNTINTLSQKTPDKRTLIEDYVQEAITEIWFSKKEGKLKHEKNLCGLVYTIARNNWYNKAKKANKEQALDDITLGKLIEEIPFELDPYSEEAIQRKAAKKAFENLGEKCKKLVKIVVIDKGKLTNLVEELGYSSYDSIKSRKFNCMKQLQKKFFETKEYLFTQKDKQAYN